MVKRKREREGGGEGGGEGRGKGRQYCLSKDLIILRIFNRSSNFFLRRIRIHDPILPRHLLSQLLSIALLKLLKLQHDLFQLPIDHTYTRLIPRICRGGFLFDSDDSGGELTIKGHSGG